MDLIGDLWGNVLDVACEPCWLWIRNSCADNRGLRLGNVAGGEKEEGLGVCWGIVYSGGTGV